MLRMRIITIKMEAKHKVVESVTFSVVPHQSISKEETNAYLANIICLTFGFVPAFTVVGDHIVDVNDDNTIFQYIT